MPKSPKEALKAKFRSLIFTNRKRNFCVQGECKIISQLPIEILVNLKFSTFATEEIGDTPSSALFAKATPKPLTNKLAMKSTHLLLNSDLINDFICYYSLI